MGGGGECALCPKSQLLQRVLTAVAVNPWAPVGGNNVGMVTVPELMSHVFQAW